MPCFKSLLQNTLLAFTLLCVTYPVQAETTTIYVPGDMHEYRWTFEQGSGMRPVTSVHPIGNAITARDQTRRAREVAKSAGIKEVVVIPRLDEDSKLTTRKTITEFRAFEKRTLETVPIDSDLAFFAHSGGGALSLWTLCRNPTLPVEHLTLSAPGLATYAMRTSDFRVDPINAETGRRMKFIRDRWKSADLTRNAKLLDMCAERIQEGLKILIVASSDDKRVKANAWMPFIRWFRNQEGLPQNNLRVILLEGASHQQVRPLAAAFHQRALSDTLGDLGKDWETTLFPPLAISASQ